jgi:LysR family transcriptional regulator, transcriptional activator of the cysJI operon
LFNLSNLLTFLHVVKCGSFSKAAQKLHVTQPTVTVHINSLENYLKCTILIRNKTGVTLTPIGKEVLKHAQAIIQECDLLEETIFTMLNVVEGDLAIGASRTIGEYYLTDFNKTFANKYDVTLTMVVDNTFNIINAVANDNIGLGLVEGNIDEKYYNTPIYNVEVFAQDEMVVVVPKCHDLFNAVSISIEKVLDYPIVLREEGSGTRRIFEDAIKTSCCSKKPSISMVLGSTEAIKAYIKNSNAIAVLSNLTIREEIKRKEFNALSIKNIPLARTFKVIIKTSSAQKIKERTYVKELLSYAGKQ